MKRKQTFLIFIFLVSLIFTLIGCGSGGGSTPTVTESPSLTKDIDLSGGSLNLNITANNLVSSMMVIPYNTSMTAGVYTGNVTTGNGSVQITNPNDLQLDPQRTVKAVENRVFNALSYRGNNFRASLGNSAVALSPDMNFYKIINDQFSSVYTKQRYLKDNCAIYLDNDSAIDQADIDTLGDTFNSFYQTMTNYFGNALNLDGSHRIVIVISPLDTFSDGSYVAGYFSWVNEKLNSELVGTVASGKSNEREMLFISPFTYDKDKSRWMNNIKGTLAHEFQHLIYFSQRLDKALNDNETFINEGLSMVSEDIAIAGAGNHNSALDDRITTYLKNSARDSLCTWNNTYYDYAPAYMFMRYYADRFGETNLKKVINSPKTGTDILLENAPSGTTFNDLFKDWLSAVAFSALNYSASSQNTYTTIHLSDYFSQFKTYSSGGYVMIPDTTGCFIYQSNLGNCSNLSVSVSNVSASFGVRVILIPVPGVSYSQLQSQIKFQ